MRERTIKADPRWLTSERQQVLHLLANLTTRELRAQYKRTALGRLWSLINPLATIAVYAVIFGLVFRGSVDPGKYSGLDSFAIWIAIGVLSWTFLSSSIMIGMNGLVTNVGLLTKVYFPRWVLVVSGILAQAANHLIELLVLLAIVGIAGGPRILLLIPALLLMLLITIVFSSGIALMLSVATVYFRDVTHLWGIFNQIWMYASGVIFPVSMIASLERDLFAQGWELGGLPLPLVTIFRLNPAERFLEAYRSIFYDFAAPALDTVLYCAGWSALVLVLGILTFRRLSPRIVEEL